jgi:lipopolysaccharide/colanic/teichoic acid biosynthesis glycosyltransferase
MVKDVLDRTVALLGLAILSPFFAVVSLLIWLQDGRSPFYVAERAAQGAGSFRMIKLRSMVAGADKGASSSGRDDPRITPVGRFIRRWKIDELSQLWNVLRGDMSLVGPRPQVMNEVATYSEAERGLLAVKPGITDFSSIVFADEGEILAGAADPDLAYRQLIWPWKSRLGLFYVAKRSLALDLQLITLTVVRIVAPDVALAGVCRLLARRGAPLDLIEFARRTTPLTPQAVSGRSEPFGS